MGWEQLVRELDTLPGTSTLTCTGLGTLSRPLPLLLAWSSFAIGSAQRFPGLRRSSGRASPRRFLGSTTLLGRTIMTRRSQRLGTTISCRTTEFFGGRRSQSEQAGQVRATTCATGWGLISESLPLTLFPGSTRLEPPSQCVPPQRIYVCT